jgi:hypothetical protein
MRKAPLFLITLLLLTANIFTQQTSWSNWSWLIGDWKGAGSGEPGKGSGTFSFTPDLDNKILIRKAHSEYPAQNGRPASVHDDLMVVYLNGGAAKSIYFDNEGHTINYSIAYTDKSITMLSDKALNTPVFRLTYTLVDKDAVNVKFEMSPDGEMFNTYVEGKCTRIKKTSKSKTDLSI